METADILVLILVGVVLLLILAARRHGFRGITVGLTVGAVTGVLFVFLTPWGKLFGFPHISWFIEQYGVGAYLLALIAVVIGLFAVASALSFGTAWERIKRGYDRTFLKTPWSMIGTFIALAGLMGLLSFKTASAAGVVETGEQMVVGFGAFFILFIALLIYLLGTEGVEVAKRG